MLLRLVSVYIYSPSKKNKIISHSKPINNKHHQHIFDILIFSEMSGYWLLLLGACVLHLARAQALEMEGRLDKAVLSFLTISIFQFNEAFVIINIFYYYPFISESPIIGAQSLPDKRYYNGGRKSVAGNQD